MTRAVATRADWGTLFEAIHGEADSDAAWAANVVDGARSLFPAADLIAAYSAAYDVSGSVRTIANQVASLLRKTNTASRRQLAARAARR